jgi:hypothetical protein
VRVFDAQQLKVFLPIGMFFCEWSWAETHFHPMNRPIVAKPRAFHITEVFVAGDRTAPEGLIADRMEQILLPPRFHSSSDRVTHQEYVEYTRSRLTSFERFVAAPAYPLPYSSGVRKKLP